MANKEYYERWLKLKRNLQKVIDDDSKLEQLAKDGIGIKPQSTAIEIVAGVYCKYCELYNKLCDIYDQTEQAQRRPYIRKIIDAVTCRILELKTMFENVEVFQFTYPDNALQQMLITPDDVQILCPFFYPYEIREAEMQYIIDQIFSGNRIGDPSPTPSEIERKEEEILEAERIKQEEKEAEIKRKLAMGEEIEESMESVQLTPTELEELRLREEYECHLFNIQRMERCRSCTRAKIRKLNKDADTYLELAGLKTPPAREEIRLKAVKMIQELYRKFMQIKRDHLRDDKVKDKLGMVFPSWSPPSAKIQLEKVKEVRRNFRRKYHENWIAEHLNEKSRVLRLREGDIIDDITSEIRAWLADWYFKLKVFDEYPWPEEGGSILIVKGETFTLQEYKIWKEVETKRLKQAAANPKSKEQIKAEKLKLKEDKKRLENAIREREKVFLKNYKKARLKPESDPGVLLKQGNEYYPVLKTWVEYENQWNAIDTPDTKIDAIRGYLREFILEDVYQEVHLQIRPIVDEMMKIELKLLKSSLQKDYAMAEVPIPITMKRKRPKKPPKIKPEKIAPAVMFQILVDQGVIRKYPATSIDEFWGDRNYAAADLRAIPWTPKFPPPCMGDVREQARVRSLLTLGCSCPTAERSQLFVGPKGAGKRTLIYAIASETNSILIDLSPMNIYNKMTGPANTKLMFKYINKISRLMQPTVILVDNADKMFYKSVPKEEKIFSPTRLQNAFFKEIIKPISYNDKILVLGTATEPWLSRGPAMFKVFPTVMLIPRTDYGSISLILSSILMKYHGVNRDFNVQSCAQALRGVDVNTIRKGVDKLMNGNRIAELYQKPLEPTEVLNAVLNYEGVTCCEIDDYIPYHEWYLSYSPFGEKYTDYMEMLESQYKYKLKAEKKRP